MFKILLADDEEYQIKHLTRMINSLNLPFSICGTADNGLRALELAQSLQPDIVICDIRMPSYDGLTVTEKLQPLLPESQFILISAYQEFDYARKGLQLGILDYLLKPIEEEKLCDVLLRAEKRLTENKTNFLRRTLFRRHGRSESSLKPVKQTLEGLMPFRLALYLPQPAEAPLLSGEWSKKFQLNPVYCLELDVVGNGCRMFILSGESKTGLDILTDSGITSGFLALSKPDIDYDSWEKKCAEMERIIWNKGRWGRSGLYDENSRADEKGYTRLITPEEEWDLGLLLKNKGLDDFLNLLTKILKNELSSHISLDTLKEGLKTVEKLLNEFYALRFNIPQNRIRQLTENLIRKLSVLNFQPDSIIEELRQRLESAIPQTNDVRIPVEEIKDYINKNYACDIDSSSLADMAGVSNTVLNTTFKEQLGLSLSKYLIYVRIEAAKRLLTYKPPMQIKEIAGKIGYEDPLYFSRIFHKKTGMYPTEYRDSN